MSASDSIKTFITPMLTGWRIQFGRWTDGLKTDRYAVIRPMGGAGASLVRRPSFSILLIGAKGDSASLPSIAADAIIEAMRTKSGDLVSMQASEAAYLAADDGRHTFEFSVTTITN
ncbi:MAG: hypothetical protein KBG00_07965 [Rhodoferax sp.]|jgi:hypothetical protein|uniref:phage tail termination protein n=1 Tax=Rhodoferax sp. TaxID=50421 RepID=UPI001B754463|nr:hypothetical protein [Rhodoferax sp.]MBP9148704.1 hypothetical protein [Rhodoferax sp.]MBP9736262.1 hypothetical protein [Rhodoferax sp.]